MKTSLWKLFPQLDQNDRFLHENLDRLVAVKLKEGQLVLREGAVCQAAPFLLTGSLRIFKTSETGREITLYRIVPGESCILSSSCIMGDSPFPAFAVAEEETVAILMPSSVFQSLIDRSASWRKLVFSLYEKRLAHVIELVEEVAFRKVDERLATLIISEQKDGKLVLTHQELADRLGSSREVVTRILRDFEKEGLITIERGRLLVLHPEILKKKGGPL